MNPLVHRTVLAMAHFTRYQVVVSNIVYVHPYLACIFFKRVGKKPPTRICHQVLQGRDLVKGPILGDLRFFWGIKNSL